MLSLDNICTHTRVDKRYYKFFCRIQPSLLHSKNSNFGEGLEEFYCFLECFERRYSKWESLISIRKKVPIFPIVLISSCTTIGPKTIKFVNSA